MILYHWTHRQRLASISLSGLDPTFAKGHMKVVWACDDTRLEWALGHIARRHDWPSEDMVLIRLDTDQQYIGASAWKGVYTNKLGYPVSVICGVRDVDGFWYTLQEFLDRGTN